VQSACAGRWFRVSVAQTKGQRQGGAGTRVVSKSSVQLFKDSEQETSGQTFQGAPLYRDWTQHYSLHLEVHSPQLVVVIADDDVIALEIRQRLTFPEACKSLELASLQGYCMAVPNN
jgi:hypothetical protein